MRFTMSFRSLALPVVALAQSSATPSSTTSSAAATSTADFEAICESQAYGYADKCPQCLYLCEDSTVPDQCYYSVFFEINYIESLCEASGGGSGCEVLAVNDVCSGS